MCLTKFYRYVKTNEHDYKVFYNIQTLKRYSKVETKELDYKVLYDILN